MAWTSRRSTLAMASIAFAMMSWKPLFNPVPMIIWNASNSVAKGLYWVENRQPKARDIAVLRPPMWALAIAVQSGYLPKNAWLLKPVAASNGTACRFGTYVFLDGYIVVKALKRDKAGRVLPVWNGCKLLRDDEVFVLSKHRDSFDSRYFGPVNTDLIIGTAKPLIILGK